MKIPKMDENQKCIIIPKLMKIQKMDENPKNGRKSKKWVKIQKIDHKSIVITKWIFKSKKMDENKKIVSKKIFQIKK